MWQNKDDRLSFSSINMMYNLPDPQEDVWELRNKDGGESIEMQNRTTISNDDLSSLDSWTQTARSSLASSMMSIDSSATGFSSACTTPGDSPVSTPQPKKKKLNLKPALKLHMDNVTWTTTKHKRRRHKYKKNIQASSAKMKAVMKQSKTPQFRFRMILLTLFGLIVTIVSFTWHMYQRQLLQIAIGDKIRFHEARRVLQLLKEDGNELVKADLGHAIPGDLNPYQCDMHSSSKICEEWKYRAKLHLNFTHTTNLSCYNIHWRSLNPDTVLRDCIALKDAYWYGMGLQRGLQWPLKKTPGEGSHALVTGSGVEEMFGGIIDRYWLSSDGVAVHVDPDVPLYVLINDNQLCLEARNDKEFPYQTTSYPISLKYTICTGKNMRSLHQDMMLSYRSPLINWDPYVKRYLTSPIWVVSPRENLTDESVQKFANKIMQYTSRLPGFLLLDTRWQQQEGSLEFKKTSFPNPRKILKIMENKGFKVLLTIHPFACLPSRIFDQANRELHLVTDKWKTVPLLTKWQGKICSLIDFTNNVTLNWYQEKLLKLKQKYSIDGFVFTGGQTTYLPRYYSYHTAAVNPDSFLIHYLSLTKNLNSFLGTEVGFLTQNFPGFARITPRTVSWDRLSGLGSVIPEILTLSILGYPLVNPGSVGGDGSGEVPSKELYLRWMELVVFLPVVQFTITPGDYDKDVIDTVYRLFSIREELVVPIYQSILEQFSDTAAPLVRPLWWIAPQDPHAHTCDSQFLVGSQIMVAPVVEENRRSRDIYLPAGWWKDHLFGEVRRGGKWLYKYPVPLTKVAYFSMTNEPL